MQPELAKVNVVTTVRAGKRASSHASTPFDSSAAKTTGTEETSSVEIRTERTAAAPGIATPEATDTQVKELAKRYELYLAYGLILLFIAVFALGRLYWDDRYYVPDEGFGYALGLTGGIMMLLALGYSLFKRTALLRKIFGLKAWLHVHIIFGVVGPLLILFHSTFHIGSLNGAVALFSMLLVFLSGVIGRFLYSKIHYGLGGKKAKIKDLQDMLANVGQNIQSQKLEAFTQSYLKKPSNLISAAFKLATYGWRSRFLYFHLTRKARRLIKTQAQQQGWDSTTVKNQYHTWKYTLRHYFFMLKKVALFSLYERFFAFWRHAHIPLLYLLLISGILHVFAVHMY